MTGCDRVAVGLVVGAAGEDCAEATAQSRAEQTTRRQREIGERMTYGLHSISDCRHSPAGPFRTRSVARRAVAERTSKRPAAKS